jgi:hypothetical protein
MSANLAYQGLILINDVCRKNFKIPAANLPTSIRMAIFLASSLLLTLQAYGQNTPQLPLGINLDSINYYAEAPAFLDLKKSSSEWLTYNVNGPTPWYTQKLNKIETDLQGYPLEIPAKIAHEAPQGVRFLINNQNPGKFRFLYDGEGKFEFNIGGAVKQENGNTFLHLDGTGRTSWINIIQSTKGNHVRNIRIIPADLDPAQLNPVFDPQYLKGLKSFHCIRFMDWMATNNSIQDTWASRQQPGYHTQANDKEVAIEYAIQLCNQLKAHAWFCVPHKADDDYIRKFALLVRDSLDPSLKVYIEYSNEIWNWMFSQAHYVLENAPGAINTYVSEDLKKINPGQADHPEKDAYMMQRVFKIWKEVFQGPHADRLIRVAAVQHQWVDNTRRILGYLFKKNDKGHPLLTHFTSTSLGNGCDAVSPAGYFSFNEEDKQRWLGMKPQEVTPNLILSTVLEEYEKVSGIYTQQTAEFAKAWGVDFVVYEGGQHFLPLQHQEGSPYNNAVWDAEIHPKMYDLYMKAFGKHASPEVNCKLFCAFSYVSQRKNLWGSWGHLEKLEQLQQKDKIRLLAPKYSALLEANSPK